MSTQGGAMSDECGFSILRRVNRERAGEAYFPVDSWSPMQWGCAIAGETGEMCNLVKKLERARPEDVVRNVEILSGIRDEMADVIVYIDLLAQRLEELTGESFDLRQCVRMKFNATSDKVGSKVKWEQR